MSSYLVEESWILNTSTIKKDLKRIREGENVTEGQIVLRNENKTMQAVYWSERRDGKNYLAVTLPGTGPQEILLQDIHLTYGPTSFMTCPGCSKRCSKLYIHPEVRKGWKCAKCHKLIYHLQSFNPCSILGIAEYRMDQFDKICLRKKPKMFYAGKPTKPLLRSIHKLEKIGMIDKAQELIVQVEEYKTLSQRISILSDFLKKSGNLAVRR